jgi:hypothetical protein
VGHGRGLRTSSEQRIHDRPGGGLSMKHQETIDD